MGPSDPGYYLEEERRRSEERLRQLFVVEDESISNLQAERSDHVKTPIVYQAVYDSAARLNPLEAERLTQSLNRLEEQRVLERPPPRSSPKPSRATRLQPVMGTRALKGVEPRRLQHTWVDGPAAFTESYY